MSLDELAGNFRYLIRDRGANFTAAFDAVFTGAGITVLRTPPQAPRANAYAERWIGTVAREALDRLLIINQRHLHIVLDEYIAHYNTHRPHQSLNRKPPQPPPVLKIVTDPGPPTGASGRRCSAESSTNTNTPPDTRTKTQP